jgi:hypothetical protein
MIAANTLPTASYCTTEMLFCLSLYDRINSNCEGTKHGRQTCMKYEAEKYSLDTVYKNAKRCLFRIYQAKINKH